MNQPRFGRLDLPRDGRELMKIAPPLDGQVQEIMGPVEARGGWRTTQDIPCRIRDPGFLAYWIMKSVDPLRRPAAASKPVCRRPVAGVADHRSTSPLWLPDGFGPPDRAPWQSTPGHGVFN